MVIVIARLHNDNVIRLACDSRQRHEAVPARVLLVGGGEGCLSRTAQLMHLKNSSVLPIVADSFRLSGRHLE